MLGIGSLLLSLSLSLSLTERDEEAAASGIGRYFRSGNPRNREFHRRDRDCAVRRSGRLVGSFSGHRFLSGGFDGVGLGIGFFDGFKLLWRWRIEDAVGQ